MQLGMIGMGKMGLPMVHNGRDHGLEIVVFSEKSEKITDLRKASRAFPASRPSLPPSSRLGLSG